MDDAIGAGSKVSPLVAALATLPFEKYAKLVGIVDPTGLREPLLAILLIYRQDLLVQSNQTVQKKFDQFRAILDNDQRENNAYKDKAEIDNLLAIPGGDRQYLHGLRSIATMDIIAAQEERKRLKKSRGGQPQKRAEQKFIYMMRWIYQDATGKKPGRGDTGPFARFLAAVHDDFRKISRQQDADLGQEPPLRLSAKIVALAKKQARV